MTEPPPKRTRRPDSKQMWDESDRRAPIPSRERHEPPREPRRDDRDRRGDRDRDRDRRYRSRSPRDSRGGRDRDRGGRRDERDRDSRDVRDGRGSGGGRDDRDGEMGGRRDGRDGDRRDRGEFACAHVGLLAFRGRFDHVEDGRGARDRPRERSRSRDRERVRDLTRDTRSRSPRRDRDRDSKRDEERERPRSLKPEDDITKSRTATPPVSFKVGPAGQDHERMDVDGEASHQNKKGSIKVKKDKVEEPIEDDDEIVVEDDGLAAMQAMMGFGGFGTTHQKKVEGNNVGAVRKEKKTEYRQYMNRVGGFNRPLSPTRE
jgi:U4/U6.U5 tri-snRNP-associated protein 3